ncbi:cupin domain-containing protein [Kitasatospora brasiliensis]|uniref:cupin domain-containing protein n=1 Tax=Kitasatospora brasiliensis TaxID=3058040 RepID=UPI00293130A3|nr:cupin domain-containing protein [Kitasatospora sp. K002]
MGADTVKGAIIRREEFAFSAFDWGRVAEPVGPAIGARKVKLNVVEVAPGAVWRQGWSFEEENVVVVFAGTGHGDIGSARTELRRTSALYSPTGRTLELTAGDEGLTAYVWRTKLVGGEPEGADPKTAGALTDSETQLRGFSGIGESPTEGESAVMNFVFWPGSGSSRLCLHCGVQQPGQTFNVHIHPESEEAFIAFEGIGQLYMHDQWNDVRPGDVLYAPPGIPHGARNPHTGPDAEPFTTCGGPTPFDPALYHAAGVSPDVK